MKLINEFMIVGQKHIFNFDNPSDITQNFEVSLMFKKTSFSKKALHTKNWDYEKLILKLLRIHKKVFITGRKISAVSSNSLMCLVPVVNFIIKVHVSKNFRY